jgi:hypothetical protein
MSKETRRIVNNRRAEAIYSFCNGLHDDLDELYELMLDGTDAEEKTQIESIIEKLKELNLDR